MNIFSNFSFNFLNNNISFIKNAFNFSSLRSFFGGNKSSESQIISWGGSEKDTTPKLIIQESDPPIAMQDYGIVYPKGESEPLILEPQFDYGIMYPKSKGEPIVLEPQFDYGILYPKESTEESPLEAMQNYGIVCFWNNNFK